MPAGGGLFAAIHDLVRMIPPGQVASYGMISTLVPGSTPRIVGFAMNGLPTDTDVPWQRVINASGGISPRPGSERQRIALEAEGVEFSKSGKVDWKKVAWEGPGPDWCEATGFDMVDYMSIIRHWPG